MIGRMRTTLTLDDDVAAALERLRKQRKQSYKDLVNEIMRQGLQQMKPRQRKCTRYETRVVSLGRSRLPNVDGIADVLAIVEGDDF